MKKIIPFTKEIEFKTDIAEITDIEIETGLIEKKYNTIDTDIIIDGTYKIYSSSKLEENFHYDIPFTIDIDDKYSIQDANIKINDFDYTVLDNILILSIELEVNNVEERIKEDLEREENKEEVVKLENIDLVDEKLEDEFLETINNNNLLNISQEETYVSYYVYIMKENDTIEEILTKYNVTKDDLELYNDISNITIGSKVIIPCHNE